MAKKDEQKHRKDVTELRERQHYLKDEHRKDAVENDIEKGNVLLAKISQIYATKTASKRLALYLLLHKENEKR